MTHTELLSAASFGVSRDNSNGPKLVQVTHVESPVLFYCRLLSDEDKFQALQDKINRLIQVQSFPDKDVSLPTFDGANKYILVYSSILDRWCRGQLLSYQSNKDQKPIIAKVCFFSYII